MRIGTIEILRQRIYPLDAESHDDFPTTVVVDPGEYELHRDGLTTFWLMRGRLNRRGFHRLGDGLFEVNTGDAPGEVEVVFPSRGFGPDEWAALVARPEFREGHELQRLRVRLAVAA
jgi:hypothetical protein